MQLIGQYDSPFVRRVAVALRLYGLDYEHLPWSTFGDADRLAAFNPLRRVPVLVLDDGEALIESGAILDYLDGLVPPGRALIAASGAARRKAMHISALATGLADKAVSFFYSRVFHGEASPVWVARCQTQIHDVLVVLERECASRGTATHRATPISPSPACCALWQRHIRLSSCRATIRRSRRIVAHANRWMHSPVLPRLSVRQNRRRF